MPLEKQMVLPSCFSEVLFIYVMYNTFFFNRVFLAFNKIVVINSKSQLEVTIKSHISSFYKINKTLKFVIQILF